MTDDNTDHCEQCGECESECSCEDHVVLRQAHAGELGSTECWLYAMSASHLNPSQVVWVEDKTLTGVARASAPTTPDPKSLKPNNMAGLISTLHVATWPDRQEGDTSAHHALYNLLAYVDRLEVAASERDAYKAAWAELRHQADGWGFEDSGLDSAMDDLATKYGLDETKP